MTDLGTLGGRHSWGADINSRGQIVGSSWTAGSPVERHAFLWDSGVTTDLGTLGGSSSLAIGVNNRGQVVGHSQDQNGVWKAFLWHRGTMTELGSLGGAARRR